MSDFPLFTFREYIVPVVAGPDGKPWFLLSSVCNVLGLSNPTVVANRLDEDMKSTLSSTEGGPARIIVSEDGLIEVIFQSRKPIAKQFKREAIEYIKSVGHHGLAVAGVTADEMALVASDPRSATLLELIRVQAQQIALEHRMDEMERRQASLGELENGYVSVVGWFNRNGGTVSEPDANIIGRKASDYCRADGIKIGQVKHERWGYVNSYPEKIVERAYKWFVRKYRD